MAAVAALAKIASVDNNAALIVAKTFRNAQAGSFFQKQAAQALSETGAAGKADATGRTEVTYATAQPPQPAKPR